jgi:hypothetical protein
VQLGRETWELNDSVLLLSYLENISVTVAILPQPWVCTLEVETKQQ